MDSLIFRVLDAQVINGLADDPAVRDETGSRSYAQLLHESACIAAGLNHMGIEAGSRVVIDLEPGSHLVTTVLAIARLGALPAESSEFTISGMPPSLVTPHTEVAWDVLDKAGRTEPAAAPIVDPEGYETALRQAYGEIFDVLERGGTVS